MPDRLKKRFPTASPAPPAGTVPTATVTVNLVSDPTKGYKVDCGDIEVTQHEFIKFELGSNSPSNAKVVGVAITKDNNPGPAPNAVFSPQQSAPHATWFGTKNTDGSLTVEDQDTLPENTPEVDYSYVLYVEYDGTTYNSDPKIRNETGQGG